MEIKNRKRERRYTAVATLALQVQSFCSCNLAALRAKPGQSAESFETRVTDCGFPADSESVVVLTPRLEDCSPLDIYLLVIRREPLRDGQVVQSISKTMKGAPGSGSRDERLSIGPLTLHQPLGILLSQFVVRDAPENLPAQRDQLDEGKLS